MEVTYADWKRTKAKTPNQTQKYKALLVDPGTAHTLIYLLPKYITALIWLKSLISACLCKQSPVTLCLLTAPKAGFLPHKGSSKQDRLSKVCTFTIHTYTINCRMKLPQPT